MDKVIDHVDSRGKGKDTTFLTSHEGDHSAHHIAEEDKADLAEKKDMKLGNYIAKFNQFS